MPWKERWTIYYGRSVCLKTKRNIASLKNDSKNTSLRRGTLFTKERNITDLYSLAEYCSFGELRDELIRDRIVVGIRSANLYEKLQLKSDLTLETALTQVRQAEAIKMQQSIIRGEGWIKPDFPVGVVNKGKPYRHGYKGKDRARPRQNTCSPSARPPSTASCS